MAVEETKIIAMCRRIIENHQYEEYDEIIVDAQTANMIITIYDKCNSKNRKMFGNFSLLKMVDVGWRLVEGAIMEGAIG